jgi:hypothetical protein
MNPNLNAHHRAHITVLGVPTLSIDPLAVTRGQYIRRTKVCLAGHRTFLDLDSRFLIIWPHSTPLLPSVPLESFSGLSRAATTF